MGWDKVGAGYWELSDLSGGKNAKIATRISDNQATDCLNWYYWNGELRNLFGASNLCGDYVNGSNVAVSGLYYVKFDDGTSKIIATAGDAIKYLDEVTNSWVDITGSVTITAGSKFKFCTVQNTLVGTNGLDPVIKWTGSGNAAVLGGSPPVAKLVMPYGNFLLLGNCTVGATPYPKRVYRSNANDIETWDSGDYWSFESENGTGINAMANLGYRGVFYHEDTMSFVSGRSSSTFVITNDAIPGIGCVGKNAISAGVIPIQSLDASGMPSGQLSYVYGHVFRSWDGFYIFTGDSPQMISDNVFTDNESKINRQQLSEMSIVPFYDRRQMWAFMAKSSSLVNNYGYVYDMVSGGWWPHEGFNAQVSCRYQKDGKWYVLIGGSDGIVRKLDTSVYEISGQSMTNYWYSKWFSVTKPSDLKMMKDLLFYIEAVGNYNLTVKLEYDLPYNGNLQSGTVSLAPSGATYPGVYGTSKYAGKGIDFRAGQSLGGDGFYHIRIRLSMSDPVGVGLEKIGAYLSSAGERLV